MVMSITISNSLVEEFRLGWYEKFHCALWLMQANGRKHNRSKYKINRFMTV